MAARVGRRPAVLRPGSVATMTDHLALLDWRRRMDAAFALARDAADPAAGHARWRAARDEMFATHPASPLPRTDPLRASGLPYADYDPAYRFEVVLVAVAPDDDVRDVDTGEDGTLRMRRIGRVDLPDPVGASLDVWWLEQYAGGLFVPLRDATAGSTTYGGGRYLLDTAKGAWHGGSIGGEARTLVLDLNFAYHPSCRYDPAWQCPLAPPGNTIEAAVGVGELLS